MVLRGLERLWVSWILPNDVLKLFHFDFLGPFWRGGGGDVKLGQFDTLAALPGKDSHF